MANHQKAAPKSTVASGANKPAKPYPGFPLFYHNTGGWTKKIRGRFVYFGRVPRKKTLDAYVEQKDDLHAGRTPRARTDKLTVDKVHDWLLAATGAKS